MNTETVTTAVQTTTQAAQAVPAAPKDNIWGLVVYCAVIFVIIYFFMVRPNKKRLAEYQKMLENLKVGNRVMAAGIYGNIKKIKEKTIDLEISKGVIIEVNKNAISNVE